MSPWFIALQGTHRVLVVCLVSVLYITTLHTAFFLASCVRWRSSYESSSSSRWKHVGSNLSRWCNLRGMHGPTAGGKKLWQPSTKPHAFFRLSTNCYCFLAAVDIKLYKYITLPDGLNKSTPRPSPLTRVSNAISPCRQVSYHVTSRCSQRKQGLDTHCLSSLWSASARCCIVVEPGKSDCVPLPQHFCASPLQSFTNLRNWLDSENQLKHGHLEGTHRTCRRSTHS